MTTMNTGAASLSDETILAIEKQVAYLAKSRNDLTIKTVRECIDAAIAAGGAQEPIYQIQMIDEAWGDVTEAQYEHLDVECKRIVYAAPLPRVAETENEALSLLRGWYEANAKGTVMVEDAAYRLVTETAALLAAASNGEQA